MENLTAADAERERTVTGKVMVYDGECPMCSGLSAAFVKLGLFPENERRPYLDYEGELAERMWEAGIRNEILVLDPKSEEIRAGAPAILWMLRKTWIRPFSRVLELRPILDIASLAYRFIAYNRRFLSVPKPRAIACACDPDERPSYQLLLIAVFVAFAAVVVTLLGQVAPPEVKLGETRVGLLGPAAAAGLGWTLLAVLGAVLLSAGERLKYVAHLATTAAAGGLVLVPLLVLQLLAPLGEPSFRIAFAGSLAIAVLWTTWLQHVRVRYQKIAGAWLLGWIAAAASGAALLGWLIPAFA